MPRPMRHKIGHENCVHNRNKRIITTQFIALCSGNSVTINTFSENVSPTPFGNNRKTECFFSSFIRAGCIFSQTQLKWIHCSYAWGIRQEWNIVIVPSLFWLALSVGFIVICFHLFYVHKRWRLFHSSLFYFLPSFFALQPYSFSLADYFAVAIFLFFIPLISLCYPVIWSAHRDTLEQFNGNVHQQQQ